MKKLLSILAIVGVVAVCAAPKSSLSSLSSCLWHVVSGGIANDTESVVVRDDGYVTATGGFFAQWSDGSYIDCEPTYFQVTGPTGRGAVFQPNAGAGGTPYDFDTEIEHTSGGLLTVGNNGVSQFAVYHDGSIVTGNGSRWVLGELIVTSTNRYVRVEIGGQIVKLAVVE